MPTEAERPPLVRIITRLNVGGPARHVTILATQMGDLNGVLLTGREDEREGTLRPAAERAGARVLTVPGLRRQVSPLSDLRALLWLYRYLRRARPRIVATHTAKAGTVGRLAAALAGVPIRVHTFHGHVLDGYFNRLLTGFYRRVEQVLGRLTTHFVAISPEIAADLDRMGIGRGKTTIVRLGLELEHLDAGRPGKLKQELGIPAGHPLVGIVGRLVPIKAHGLFLEAAAQLRRAHPDLEFVVAGDGDLWAQLHRRAAELGLGGAVHFVGWRDDLADLYAGLEVVVCCSLNEGTPVSLLEAGAAGKPVVGTRVGGVPDIIRDGENGLLVPSGDASALATAVSRVLGDPRLARRLGEAGRRLALSGHGAGRMVDDLRCLYEQLLNEKER